PRRPQPPSAPPTRPVPGRVGRRSGPPPVAGANDLDPGGHPIQAVDPVADGRIAIGASHSNGSAPSRSSPASNDQRRVSRTASASYRGQDGLRTTSTEPTISRVPTHSVLRSPGPPAPHPDTSTTNERLETQRDRPGIATSL